MKKLALLSTLIVACASLSAYGQGYFQFTSGKSQAWNGFTGGAAALNTDVNTAFLWAANGAVPTIAGIAASTPSSLTVGSSTFTAANAWSAILTDPNFTLAVNNANSQVAVQRTLANGSISYNGGFAFAVSGSSVDTMYRVYFIGWNGAYATPSLAAAAASVNGYVGWSAPFNYSATAQTATPDTMVGKTGQFGVGGIVPEPSTIALAGLGGLAMLLIRRRK